MKQGKDIGISFEGNKQLQGRRKKKVDKTKEELLLMLGVSQEGPSFLERGDVALKPVKASEESSASEGARANTERRGTQEESPSSFQSKTLQNEGGDDDSAFIWIDGGGGDQPKTIFAEDQGK